VFFTKATGEMLKVCEKKVCDIYGGIALSSNLQIFYGNGNDFEIEGGAFFFRFWEKGFAFLFSFTVMVWVFINPVCVRRGSFRSDVYLTRHVDVIMYDTVTDGLRH
jgi:hypothetical protein